MLILAVDTAGPNCAACIYDSKNNAVLSSISEEIGRGHAEFLPGIVDRTLTQANLTFSDLNLLAVSEGPGSFAGIRVGISFIRALALALKIPSIGVSSLVAMAYAVQDHMELDVMATIDARRDEIYLAVLDKQNLVLIEPAKCTIDDANTLIRDNSFLLCGNGVDALEINDSQVAHRKASPPIESIALLASQNLKLSRGEINPPKPQYLRAADAKKQAGFVLDRL